MTIQIKASILGHPWDLWGLARLFDGKNEEGLLIEATEPAGMPAVNHRDQKALDRFHRFGHAQLATLTANDLCRSTAAECDLNTAATQAQAMIVRINGIAKLLDPEYYGVQLDALSYNAPGGSGGAIPSKPTQNKGYTNLGRHPSQSPAAVEFIALAKDDAEVNFVLEAFNLPISWASLYLVYDCIASAVGSRHDLADKLWVDKAALDAFTMTANKSRAIRVGIRHGSSPAADPPKPLIPLHEGHNTVMRLAMAWLQTRRS
jgi:hypothetical protein